MIKLTTMHGKPAYVNPANIAVVFASNDGAFIVPCGGNGHEVRESPAIVVSAIGAHVPVWAQRMTDILDRLEKGEFLT